MIANAVKLGEAPHHNSAMGGLGRGGGIVSFLPVTYIGGVAAVVVTSLFLSGEGGGDELVTKAD